MPPSIDSTVEIPRGAPQIQPVTSLCHRLALLLIHSCRSARCSFWHLYSLWGSRFSGQQEYLISTRPCLRVATIVEPPRKMLSPTTPGLASSLLFSLLKWSEIVFSCSASHSSNVFVVPAAVHFVGPLSPGKTTCDSCQRIHPFSARTLVDMAVTRAARNIIATNFMVLSFYSITPVCSVDFIAQSLARVLRRSISQC